MRALLYERGPSIAPGVAAVLLMDITFARDKASRSTLSLVGAPGGEPPHMSFTGASTPVRRARAIDIARKEQRTADPLKGAGRERPRRCRAPLVWPAACERLGLVLEQKLAEQPCERAALGSR